MDRWQSQFKGSPHLADWGRYANTARARHAAPAKWVSWPAGELCRVSDLLHIGWRFSPQPISGGMVKRQSSLLLLQLTSGIHQSNGASEPFSSTCDSSADFSLCVESDFCILTSLIIFGSETTIGRRPRYLLLLCLRLIGCA
jgi:hypothetical protein